MTSSQNYETINNSIINNIKWENFILIYINEIQGLNYIIKKRKIRNIHIEFTFKKLLMKILKIIIMIIHFKVLLIKFVILLIKKFLYKNHTICI